MKERHGFVSNSSSSSFVFIGVKVTEAQIFEYTGVDTTSEDPWEDVYEAIDARELELFGDGDGDHYLGYRIDTVENGSFEESSKLSLHEISVIAHDVSVELNVCVDEVKLICFNDGC